MNQILNYKKWMIVIFILLGSISFYYYFIKDSPSSELIRAEEEESFVIAETNEPSADTTEEEIEENTLVIDIKGAIAQPGVYEMATGARVHQLIDKAGGLKDEADELAINLAAPLVDGMVIYIPKKGEGEENPILIPTQQESEGKQDKVNINLATSDELQKLTGIGPSKAEAIITYREENGPFKAPEGLLEVSGIGEKSLEKIKEEITIK